MHPFIRTEDAMNKYEPSPTSSPGNGMPDATQRTGSAGSDPAGAGNPNRGETAQRQKRPRAPQFGTDRRNPRDLDARRPKSARHHGDADGLPQNMPQDGGGGGNYAAERRKATRDRRQSHS